MNKENVSRNTYKYKPEPVKEGVIDWVTFTEPDYFAIERTLTDGRKITCSTKITSSSAFANAWSAEDVMQAISKESIQQILKSDINVIRLQTTLGNEGINQSFIFKWMNKTLTILPPDSKDTETPKADEDAAGLVYVLTKIYKQQLNRQECKSLERQDEDKRGQSQISD
ncbi:MAG: hypothetical protein GXP08_01475 [Gammaproteobacteria bacterium]|nr:hypothetical protein [Gammaproteobacteria bacterium]